MSEYELVKKLGSYDNFKGLKSMAKVPWHKLFARNKLSAPTVPIPIIGFYAFTLNYLNVIHVYFVATCATIQICLRTLISIKKKKLGLHLIFPSKTVQVGTYL